MVCTTGMCRGAILAAILGLGVSSAPTVEASALEASWKNGFHLKSEDGQFKATIGGRIMQDWAFINESDDVPAAQSSPDGVEFRRARLYMAGNVFKSVEFKSQWDFSGGGASVKDLYIGIKNIPGVGTVRVGNMHEPFSFDELTSSKYITFIERSLTTGFAPSRNPGIRVHNGFADGRGTLAVGLFREDDGTGESVGDGEYAQTARVTFLPVHDKDTGAVFHLGAAVSHRKPPGGEVEYSFRPENHLGEKVLSTTPESSVKLKADDVLLVSGEIAAIAGSFSMQGEVVSTTVSGPTDDPMMMGFSASASYFLTGEQRAYKTSSATFSRTKVKKNFDPENGGAGAWEIAARVSRVDLEDTSEGLDAGTLTDFTAALNWYLNPVTRIMLNHVVGQVETPAWEGDVHSTQARFQIDF